MKRLVCHTCGSNKFTLKDEHYICQYCGATYIKKEGQLQEEKKDDYKYLFALIVILLISISLWFFYDSPQKEKKITIKNNTIIKQPLWNLFYDKKKATTINSLELIKKDTYLLSGDNDSNAVWMSELDKEGKELWYKTFPNNIPVSDSRAIEVDDGYIISYKSHSDIQFKTSKVNAKSQIKRTIKLDKNHNVVYYLPQYFTSMFPTKKGFIGITKNEIMHVDKDGNLFWYIDYKALDFRELVQLNNKSFVAMGYEKGKGLKLINFTESRKVLWNKNLPTSHIAVRDAVATRDGGFILNSSVPIRIMKFTQNGELEWNRRIKVSQHDFGRTIEEVEDGYLALNNIEEKGVPGLLVLKLDKEGNEIWRKVHHSSHGLLHLIDTVKVKDQGYLVSISPYPSSPWLVNMDKNGQIDTDFSTVDYHLQGNVIRNYHKESKKEYGFDVFKGKRGAWFKAKASKDNHYIYGVTEVGGFQIIDIENSDIPKVASQFKFKVFKRNGQTVHNLPLTFALNKEENIAVIIDNNYGVYILDISDKRNPKLMSRVENMTNILSVIFSEDENIFYLGTDIGKVLEMNISNLKLPIIEKEYDVMIYDNSNLMPNVQNIIHSKKKPNILYVSLDDRLIVWDTKEAKKKAVYHLHNTVRDMVLSEDENTLYAAEGTSIEILQLHEEDIDIKSVSDIFIGCFSQSIILDDKENKLYAGCMKSSVKVIDIKDRLNPSIIKEYSGLDGGEVRNITLSTDKKSVILSYGVKGVGMIKLK